MNYLYLFFALFAPTLSTHVYWDPPQAQNNIVEVNSTVNILSGNVTGYYYATSGWFNSSDAGYFGWQPRAGQELQHLTFSAFGKGPYSDSPQCGNGADGGNGVSCALEYPWKFNQNYTICMRRTETKENGDNKWTGWIVDDVTGEETLIAYYWTPKSYGLLRSDFVTFDEHYSWVPGEETLPPRERTCIPKSKYIQYGPLLTSSTGKVSQTVLYTRDTQVGIQDKCSYAAQASNWNITVVSDTEVIMENGILTK